MYYTYEILCKDSNKKWDEQILGKKKLSFLTKRSEYNS